MRFFLHPQLLVQQPFLQVHPLVKIQLYLPSSLCIQPSLQGVEVKSTYLEGMSSATSDLSNKIVPNDAIVM